MGGLEDKNTLIIWDVETGKALYGSPLGINPIQQISFFNKSDDKLLAVQVNGVQIVVVDRENRKIRSMNVNFGNMKRVYTCAILDFNDEFAYCGTKTGDVLEINIEKAIFKRVGPVKKLFSQGVRTIAILPNGDVIVGAGDGTLAKLSIQDMNIKE